MLQLPLKKSIFSAQSGTLEACKTSRHVLALDHIQSLLASDVATFPACSYNKQYQLLSIGADTVPYAPEWVQHDRVLVLQTYSWPSTLGHDEMAIGPSNKSHNP